MVDTPKGLMGIFERGPAGEWRAGGIASMIRNRDPNAPMGAWNIVNGRYVNKEGFPLSVRGPDGKIISAMAPEDVAKSAETLSSKLQKIRDQERLNTPSTDLVTTPRPEDYRPNWVEYRNTLPVPRNSTDVGGIESTSGFFPNHSSTNIMRPGPSSPAGSGGLPSVIESMPHGQSTPPFVRGQGDPGFRTNGLQRNALGNLAMQNMLQSQLHSSDTSSTAGSPPPAGPNVPAETPGNISPNVQPPIEAARPRLELPPDNPDGFSLTPDAANKRADPVIQQAVNSARQVVAREPTPAHREQKTVYWGDPDRASDFFRADKQMQQYLKDETPFVGRSGLPSDPDNMKRGGAAKGMNRDAVVHKALEIIHHMLMRGH